MKCLPLLIVMVFLTPLITLEILENAGISNESVIKNLRRIGKNNINISIDDFGTGYSSLSHLTQLLAKELKIDQSFLRKIPGEENSEKLLINIFKMGEIFNLSLICEGIETLEQLEFVQKHGCTYAQGFYFHAPMGVIEIINLLSKNDQLIETPN